MRCPYAKLCSLYLLLMRKLLALWLSPAECHQMCQNQNHAAISSFPESHQYYTILLHLYTTQYFRIVGFTLCQKQTCQIYMQKYFDGFKTDSKWIICTYIGICIFYIKVNRCLARYSPRVTATNQPTTRAPNEPARPGPKWPKMPILGQIRSF